VPALLAGAATFVLSGLRDEQFRTAADVRVVDPSAGTVVGEQVSAATGLREVTTQVEVASSANVRAAADEQMGPDAAAAVSSIDVAAVDDSDLIRITATATNASAAAAAANALGEVYVKSRSDEITERYTAAAVDLRAKAEEIKQQADLLSLALTNEPPDSLEAERLRTQRAELERQSREFDSSAREYELEAALRADTISIVNPAAVPESPFAPVPLRDAILAGLLTALAAVAVIFLVDRLDQRIKTPEDLRTLPDAPPVLGVVPDLGERKARQRQPTRDARAIITAGSPPAEAFRKLRSSVWLQAINSDIRSLVITSTQQGEGKSTVTANLAVSLTLGGLRVAVVSADLRAPDLGSFFKVDENEIGLSDVLQRAASLEEVTRAISVGDTSMKFIPSGSPPFDPGMVLGSVAMKNVVSELVTGGAEIVLIDSAPVEPVGDTVDLVRNADAALFVVRAHSSTGDRVGAALDSIGATGTPVMGGVLNALRTADLASGSAYGYGYGYGAGYGSAPAERPETLRQSSSS